MDCYTPCHIYSGDTCESMSQKVGYCSIDCDLALKFHCLLKMKWDRRYNLLQNVESSAHFSIWLADKACEISHPRFRPRHSYLHRSADKDLSGYQQTEVCFQPEIIGGFLSDASMLPDSPGVLNASASWWWFGGAVLCTSSFCNVVSSSVSYQRDLPVRISHCSFYGLVNKTASKPE